MRIDLQPHGQIQKEAIQKAEKQVPAVQKAQESSRLYAPRPAGKSEICGNHQRSHTEGFAAQTIREARQAASRDRSPLSERSPTLGRGEARRTSQEYWLKEPSVQQDEGWWLPAPV